MSAARRCAAAAVLALGLALGFATDCPAARPAEADPFLVPADSIHGVNRLALVPAHVIGSTWIPRPDSVFAARLQAGLEGAGHAVLPPDTAVAAWAAAAAGVGGIYDRRSGRPDSTRARLAAEAFSIRLRDSLGVDGVARYHVLDRTADLDNGHVRWDGVEQRLGPPGLIWSLTMRGTSGKIAVQSLELEILDLEGRTLYRRRGGLASLSLRTKAGWVDVRRSAILADTALTSRAIERVLGPWRERDGGSAREEP